MNKTLVQKKIKTVQDVIEAFSHYPGNMRVRLEFCNYRYEDREQTDDIAVVKTNDAVIIIAEPTLND